MAREATVNGRHKAESPVRRVRRNLAGLGHDVISLAELQLQLISLDVRETASKSIMPVVLLVCCVLLGLGVFPVLLMGLGWLLVEQAGLSQASGFLIAGGAALLVAAVLGAAGLWGLRKALQPLSRSREELQENVRWIKNALRHSSR